MRKGGVQRCGRWEEKENIVREEKEEVEGLLSEMVEEEERTL